MSADIDLYLGGAIGRWVLSTLEGEDAVRRVISSEAHTRELAQSFGYRVLDAIPSQTEIRGGVGVSVHFPIIFQADVIECYKRMYNLHPGFLPWGRGYFPVFWALWERTPAGATFHEITVGLDKGAIVAQTRVDYTEADTGQSLHDRVIEAEKALFLDYWPQLCSGELPEARSQSGGGSYRSLKDFLAIRDQPPLEDMTAYDLVRLAQCLTFADRPGPLVKTARGSYRLALQSDP